MKAAGSLMKLIAVSTVFLLTVAACGGGSATSAPSPAPTAAVTVAPSTAANPAAGKNVTLLTVSQTCDYCAQHTDAFKKAAEEAGVKLTIVVNEFDASVQAQQVSQAISTKPDLIVLWPADASAIKPSLEKIKQAGIPVIISNSSIPGDSNGLWVAFAGPSDYTEGSLAADAMIAGFKEKGYGDSGNVIMVTGVPGTPPAINRAKGFTEGLTAKAPGIKVLGDQPGNWDQTQATTAAAALLTQFANDGVKGIYAEADNMLAGAVTAAERAGLDPKSLVSVGNNCSIEGYTGIEAGTMYASILQSPVVDGLTSAKAMVDFFAGTLKADLVMDTPIITKANLADCASAVGK